GTFRNAGSPQSIDQSGDIRRIIAEQVSVPVPLCLLNPHRILACGYCQLVVASDGIGHTLVGSKMTETCDESDVIVGRRGTLSTDALDDILCFAIFALLE